jgi:hypothetical protein
MKGHRNNGRPNHADPLEHETKSLAQVSSEHFDGKVTL